MLLWVKAKSKGGIRGLYIYGTRLSVHPARISSWSNPNRRCDHTSTTMARIVVRRVTRFWHCRWSLGSVSDCRYLWLPEVDFSESRQIAYLVPEMPIFTLKIFLHLYSVKGGYRGDRGIYPTLSGWLFVYKGVLRGKMRKIFPQEIFEKKLI